MNQSNLTEFKKEEDEMIIFEKIAHPDINPYDNTDIKMTIHSKEMPLLDDLIDTMKDFIVACGYGTIELEAHYPDGDKLTTYSKD
jgi:hypothetical protein